MIGIDHVAIVVRQENLDDAAARWAEVLGLHYEAIHDEELGVRAFLDLEAGVELIAPLGRTGRFGDFFSRFLDEHGEGLQSVVLRVDDLDGAKTRALSAGCRLLPAVARTLPAVERILPAIELHHDDPPADRSDRFVELPLAPIWGTHVTLAGLEKKPWSPPPSPST
ncbi:MAG: VOC family protein [Actinobacteria bacterium]|nr:VOC family protein [Actinomycetota bacterium]